MLKSKFKDMSKKDITNLIMFSISVIFTVVFRIINKFDNSMIWFFADMSTILGVARNIFLSKGRFLAYPILVISSALIATSLILQGVYLSAIMYFFIAIPSGCISMYVFIRNHKQTKEGTTLIKAKPLIKTFSTQMWIVMTTITVVSSIGLMILGYHMGDKQYISSALVLVFSGLGFMLGFKMYLEQFYYFLASHVVNVIMFASLLSSNINNLSSIVLFSMLTVIGSFGLYNWIVMYKKQVKDQNKPQQDIDPTTPQTKPSTTVA